MENSKKTYYCPTCDGELEMLSGCGAVGYFCNHCRKLVSRSKMKPMPTIEYGRTALLVIDMQTGLLARDIWNKEELIANVNKLIQFSRQKGIRVVFARHTNDSLSKEGTVDWQVCDCIHTKPDDVFVDKKKSSVFQEKAFLGFLKEYEISAVIVAGLVSNGCVKAACEDGLKNGLKVVLAEDGHSTFHKGQEATVREWNRTLAEQGAVVLKVEDIVSA